MAEHILRQRTESQQALDEAIAKTAHAAAYQIAEVFAWRGETNQAFEWLQRAYRQRNGGQSGIKPDPLLKSLHGDARFSDLLRLMHLPE